MKEINLKEALLINNPFKNKNIFYKTSNAIIREFNEDKYGSIPKLLEDNPEYKLTDIERLEISDSLIHIFYDNKHYKGPAKWLLEKIKITIIDSYLRILKFKDFNSITEFGAGYGSKIITLMESNYDENISSYFAVDISQNGLKACQELAKRIGKKVDIIQHDFNNDLLSDLAISNNTLLLTVYNLHYWKKFSIKEFLKFLDIGITGGIHIEPCSDLLSSLEDKSYKDLVKEYIKKNDYAYNIAKPFIEAQKMGYIHLEIKKEMQGSGFLPASNIIWWKI